MRTCTGLLLEPLTRERAMTSQKTSHVNAAGKSVTRSLTRGKARASAPSPKDLDLIRQNRGQNTLSFKFGIRFQVLHEEIGAALLKIHRIVRVMNHSHLVGLGITHGDEAQAFHGGNRLRIPIWGSWRLEEK